MYATFLVNELSFRDAGILWAVSGGRSQPDTTAQVFKNSNNNSKHDRPHMLAAD